MTYQHINDTDQHLNGQFFSSLQPPHQGTDVIDTVRHALAPFFPAESGTPLVLTDRPQNNMTSILYDIKFECLSYSAHNINGTGH